VVSFSVNADTWQSRTFHNPVSPQITVEPLQHAPVDVHLVCGAADTVAFVWIDDHLRLDAHAAQSIMELIPLSHGHGTIALAY
jgi:hypothetical protein